MASMNTTPETKRFCIKAHMDRMWLFIEPYLPLANSQGSEFIVNNLWEIVPIKVQKELLKMSDIELSLLPSFNYHTPCTKEIENNDSSFIKQALTDAGKDEIPVKGIHQSLHAFKDAAQGLTLSAMNCLTTIEELNTLLRTAEVSREDSSHMLMSQKKCHEVDVMSEVCSHLSNCFQTNLTVDMGSGKGYLSTQLCSQYGHRVVGIDASISNTDAATSRAERLTKVMGTSLECSLNIPFKPVETVRSGKEVTKEKEKMCDIMRITNIGETFKDTDENSSNCLRAEQKNTEKISSEHSNSNVLKVTEDLKQSGIENENNTFKLYPGKKNDLKKPQDKNTKQTVQQKSGRSMLDKVDVNLKDKFVSLTKYIDCDTELVESITGALSQLQLEADSVRILLTGLHTCGGLGSSILRLFVSSPSAHVLCNVACCYNLLEEEFMDNTKEMSGEMQCSKDFPMSAHMRAKHATLGKAARNIACLAVHRMAAENELPGQSFYPRAMLQKIVQDQVGEFDWSGRSLRKLDKKSTSLHDYIHKCFTKLGLPSETITKELVDKYDKENFHMRQKLSAFVQLRAVLAPCLESFILLDRALYLLEQERVEDVYLVQLFDPVISPRCHAIVATKKHTINKQDVS